MEVFLGVYHIETMEFFHQHHRQCESGFVHCLLSRWVCLSLLVHACFLKEFDGGDLLLTSLVDDLWSDLEKEHLSDAVGRDFANGLVLGFIVVNINFKCLYEVHKLLDLLTTDAMVREIQNYEHFEIEFSRNVLSLQDADLASLILVLIS